MGLAILFFLILGVATIIVTRTKEEYDDPKKKFGIESNPVGYDDVPIASTLFLAIIMCIALGVVGVLLSGCDTTKAEGAGLYVVYINPAYTSQTCSVCGELGKREKHRFSCQCGTRLHADSNAARNIAGFARPIGSARGSKVTRPIFAHHGLHDAAENPVL